MEKRIQLAQRHGDMHCQKFLIGKEPFFDLTALTITEALGKARRTTWFHSFRLHLSHEVMQLKIMNLYRLIEQLPVLGVLLLREVYK